MQHGVITKILHTLILVIRTKEKREEGFSQNSQSVKKNKSFVMSTFFAKKNICLNTQYWRQLLSHTSRYLNPSSRRYCVLFYIGFVKNFCNRDNLRSPLTSCRFLVSASRYGCVQGRSIYSKLAQNCYEIPSCYHYHDNKHNKTSNNHRLETGF